MCSVEKVCYKSHVTVIKLFCFFPGRVDSLNHCLSTLNKFVDLYQDVLASFEVFAPVNEHLQRYVFTA